MPFADSVIFTLLSVPAPGRCLRKFSSAAHSALAGLQMQSFDALLFGGYLHDTTWHLAQAIMISLQIIPI